MRKFKVRCQFQGPKGERIRWSGDVEVEPGVNIFQTARRQFMAARRRAKKGANVRAVRMLAVPV